MNFLGHNYVARHQNPEVRVGAMLPDFVGMSGQRFVENPLKIAEDKNPNRQAILGGVAIHYKTDEIFDGIDEVKALRRSFRDEIIPEYFGSINPPLREKHVTLWGDVGIDLLFDGYIIQRHSESTSSYYEALASTDDNLIDGLVPSRSRLVETMRYFETSLPNYTDPHLVAQLIRRRTARPRIAPNGVVRFSKLTCSSEFDMPVARSLAELQILIGNIGNTVLRKVDEALSLPN